MSTPRLVNIKSASEPGGANIVRFSIWKFPELALNSDVPDIDSASDLD